MLQGIVASKVSYISFPRHYDVQKVWQTCWMGNAHRWAIPDISETIKQLGYVFPTIETKGGDALSLVCKQTVAECQASCPNHCFDLPYSYMYLRLQKNSLASDLRVKRGHAGVVLCFQSLSSCCLCHGSFCYAGHCGFAVPSGIWVTCEMGLG